MVQQTLTRVSYLTTLNNVYISETDNKGTPNTESGFMPSGPVSITGLSAQSWAGPNAAATLIKNTIVLVHQSNRGRQGRQPRAQTGLELTHPDPDARQQLTAKITTLCFSESTVIMLLSVCSLGRGMDKTTQQTTDESTLLHSECCHVETHSNTTNAEVDAQSDPFFHHWDLPSLLST